MSDWTKLIEQSGIITHLHELGPALDQARDRADLATDSQESLERIRTVLTFIGKRLDGADGHLLLASGLQAVAAPISTATAHVKSFAGDGEPAHLVQANAAIDSAVNAFALLVLPTKTADLRGLREAADSYREAMVEQVKSYESEVSQAGEEIDKIAQRAEAVSATVDSEKQRLEAVMTTVEQQASAKLEALTARQKQVETDLDALSATEIAALKTKFDAAHDARATEHDELLATERDAFEKLRDGHDSKLKELEDHYRVRLNTQTQEHEQAHSALRSDYEEKARAILQQMETNLLRAKKVMGDIGDHGIVGGFKTAADEAKAEVIFWHRVTYCSMFFLIAVGLATAFHFFESTLTWITLASRLFLSIATGVLAAYAASQASRYQQRERRNRKLELELRALGPFLEPVEPAEREKFRLKIAEAFFGQDEGTSEKPGPATPFHLSKESIKQLLDLASTLADKLPKP